MITQNPDSRDAEIRAILDMVPDEGADVFGPITAVLLRKVDMEAPGLLHITQPQGQYGPKDTHPYFGVVLTEAGKAMIGRLPTNGA